MTDRGGYDADIYILRNQRETRRNKKLTMFLGMHILNLGL